MIACPNKNSKEWKEIEDLSTAHVIWDKTKGDISPSLYQVKSPSDKIQEEELHESIKHVATIMAAKIGVEVEFENDIDKPYKGYFKPKTFDDLGHLISENQAVINLAYATSDTPIHEVVGHLLVSEIRNTNPELFNNLASELSTGRGAEVFNKVKERYNKKYTGEFSIFKNDVGGYHINYKDGTNEYGKNLSTSGRFDSLLKETSQSFTYEKAKAIVEELKTKKYTLEQQQEEAIVELIGLYTAERLDKKKDANLITLIRQLLKEMSDVIKSLFSQKEIEIAKLPNVVTIGDIANILAYRDSKLIPKGKKVEYRTPDGKTFSSYRKASEWISELANLENVDFTEVEKIFKNEVFPKAVDIYKDYISIYEDYLKTEKYQAKKAKDIENAEKELENLKKQRPTEIPKDIEFDSPKGFVTYFTSSKTDELRDLPAYANLEKGYEGYLVIEDSIAQAISKEEANQLWINDNMPQTGEQRSKEWKLHSKIGMLKDDIEITDRIEKLKNKIKNYTPMLMFLSENLQFDISKMSIDQYKKINNIVYDPNEIYARGQQFYSVANAFSKFDLKLLFQNLLSHLEDHEKIGAEYTVSASSDFENNTNTSGKVRYRIYPTADQIKWATAVDCYSGSVHSANRITDKQVEVAGVSFTKAPENRYLDSVTSRAADAIENVEESFYKHNEYGIQLTPYNFRLEYDSDIDADLKKIIDTLNTLLDSRYGELQKPEPISFDGETVYALKEDVNISPTRVYKTLGEAQAALDKLKADNIPGWSIEEFTINMDNYQKAIDYIRIPGNKNVSSELLDTAYLTSAAIDLLMGKKPVDIEIGMKDIFSIVKETMTASYTQGMINRKLVALKDAARRFPRSLISSRLVQDRTIDKSFMDQPLPKDLNDDMLASLEEDTSDWTDELPDGGIENPLFQKISREKQQEVRRKSIEERYGDSTDSVLEIVERVTGKTEIPSLTQVNSIIHSYKVEQARDLYRKMRGNVNYTANQIANNLRGIIHYHNGAYFVTKGSGRGLLERVENSRIIFAENMKIITAFSKRFPDVFKIQKVGAHKETFRVDIKNTNFAEFDHRSEYQGVTASGKPIQLIINFEEFETLSKEEIEAVKNCN